MGYLWYITKNCFGDRVHLSSEDIKKKNTDLKRGDTVLHIVKAECDNYSN